MSLCTRRRFLTLLTGTSTTILLAACGPGAPTRPEQPAAAAPRENIPAPIAPQPGPGQAGQIGGSTRALIELPAPPAAPATALPASATAVATQPPAPTATTVPPTATAVPPTATPVPPTATAVPPTATPVPPTATAIPFNPARLTDKLGFAQTSYAGSISERAWNVELAAKRLDGTRVGPGEVFSFNEAVGPTTIAAGFRIGYGITMNNDRPTTVPSVAGGICQVATTVFQAAYHAGMTFVERHYHLYWISRYGQPPSGKTGFDATVDDPGVDLKFRNTTEDWIRLDAYVDGANIAFTIVGVDPGWEIETIGPRIYDVVPANQAVIREFDASLPPGRELMVEHAEDGFRVSVSRLVKLDGKIVDRYDFTNRYRPSRNVILVGGRAPARSAPVQRAQPVQVESPPPAPTEAIDQPATPAPAGAPPSQATANQPPAAPAQPAPASAPPGQSAPPPPAPTQPAPAPAAPPPPPAAPAPAQPAPAPAAPAPQPTPRPANGGLRPVLVPKS